MLECDLRVEADQSLRLGGTGGLRRNATLPGSTPQQRRVPDGLCRCQEQQLLRLRGQGLYAASKACLDPSWERGGGRHVETARQARHGEASGQLEEGQGLPRVSTM